MNTIHRQTLRIVKTCRIFKDGVIVNNGHAVFQCERLQEVIEFNNADVVSLIYYRQTAVRVIPASPWGYCANDDFDAVVLSRLHHKDKVRASIVRDQESVRRCTARLPPRIDIVGADKNVDRLRIT